MHYYYYYYDHEPRCTIEAYVKINNVSVRPFFNFYIKSFPCCLIFICSNSSDTSYSLGIQSHSGYSQSAYHMLSQPLFSHCKWNTGMKH